MIRRYATKLMRHRGIARAIALSSVVAWPLLAAGCANEIHMSEADAPRELGTELLRLHHPVEFGADSVQLSPAVQAGLAEFLGRARLGHGDEVILTPVGGDPRGQMARVGAVAAVFEERRVHPFEAPAQAQITGVQPNAVLVTIERHSVILPDCPDWQKPADQNWKNLPMPNFGCANQTNLGLMVADPGDLERGREMGPADAARTTLGIERYRSGEEEQLVDESIAVE